MKKMCYRCMKNTGVGGYCSICGAPIRTQRDIGDDYLLPLGTQLDEGNIVVGEKLGRGGFGITYIALDTSQFGVIALKEFVPSFMINSMRINNSIYIDAQDREKYLKYMGFFRDEANTLSKLNHPNIVRVYFEFEENNTCYYGMELLKGKNLYEMMGQGVVLTAENAFRLIEPILDAMEYIHSQNVLHRDISPSNIFLRDAPGKFMDVDPCLIDFGAAYDAQVAFSRSAPHIKTKGFSPPEQNAGHKFYGQFSDVYAISAVLYYLVTRRMPVASEDRYLRGARLVEPHTLDNSIPKAFSDAIMRGMILESAQRTQTVRILRQELKNGLLNARHPSNDVAQQTDTPLTKSGLLSKKSSKDKDEGPHAPHVPEKPQEYYPTPKDTEHHSSPKGRIDDGKLRSFLGSVMDTLLFAGLWTLMMSVSSLNEIVSGNVWVGGIATFVIAVLCNVITCLSANGTLGEKLAQAPCEPMESDKAMLYALKHSIYPYALFSKLPRLFRGEREDREAAVTHSSLNGMTRSRSARGGETKVTGPRLESVNPVDHRVCIRELALNRSGQILGRKAGSGTNCDVAVSDSMCVSRKHCRIAFDEQWYIEDCNSKNGTFVNGKQISTGKRILLKDGCRISLGGEGIEFFFHER